jgi:hypothetical protein
MTDITLALESVQASLQANAALMALLGDDENPAGDPACIIVANPEVPDMRDLTEIVQAMEEGTVLVAFRGMTMGRRGNIPRFSYHFAIIYRAAGEIGVADDPSDPDADSTDHPGYFELFNATMQGVSIEPPLGWYDTTINENFDPPEFESFAPAKDAKGTTYWQFNFSLIDINLP